MPRRKRELADEGIYHVFNRGNDRRNLFQDENDFRFFLRQLTMAKQEMNAEIYHYCIMGNHFHLLIRVQKGDDLPKLMHRTQLAYARHFKRKYSSVGHVFQERFRSPKIPEESYYLQCGRYIERNPVKAGLVSDPAQYPWSSAGYYVLGETDPLITPNIYYADMGKSNEERCLNYQKFLSIEGPYAHIVEEALART